MSDTDGPVVNLYNSGTANVRLRSGNRVLLTQNTDYPVGNCVKFKVKPEETETFTLALRIPAWSEQNALSINGKRSTIEIKPGTYLRVHRKWTQGDTIELKLDLRGRIISEPTGKNFIALARGPIVLALDSRLCPEKPTTALKVKPSEGAYVTLTPNPQAAAKAGVRLAQNAIFTAKDGSEHTLTFCDYASAGNTWDDKSLYRVWLSQPLDLATVWERFAALAEMGLGKDTPPDASATEEIRGSSLARIFHEGIQEKVLCNGLSADTVCG